MSQLKVNSISDSAGANGNAITLASDGTCTAKATNNLGHKNLIINGACNVAQYGTSQTSVDGIQGYTTVDRFKIGWGGANNIIETHQETLTSSDTGPWEKGFRNAYKLVNGAQSGADAGDEAHISYRLEAQDMANSGWNYTSSSSYITLSFWVKSSVAQEFHGFLLTADGTQQLYSFSLGNLSANTWTKVTKTIPGNSNLQFDNNNAEGLLIRIALFRGTDKTGTITQNQWAAFNSSIRYPNYTSTWWTTNDATFAITGVQLTVTDYCPDYPHISYGEELARCQRYFFAIIGNNTDYAGINGYANSDSEIRFNVQFPVPMRATPTWDGSATACYLDTANDSDTANINDYSIIRSSPTTCPTSFTVKKSPGSATAGQGGQFEFRADNGYIHVSAEF